MRRRRCWITTFYSENRQTNVAGRTEQWEFQKGMDLSFIPELEDAGVQVKDFDGTVMDPLDLVQKYGVNSVRLRIWNAPEHVRESGGYCSYAHTLAMAKRIRAHGMSFMLDSIILISGRIPGQQRKPKDWENFKL